MQMISIRKGQFAELNNRSYYYSDGTVSFPYGHPFLEILRQKKKKYKKIHEFVKERKLNYYKKILKLSINMKDNVY